MWQLKARFCPLCGGALCWERIEERDRPRCAGCRFILYANPAPAAATVVLDHDHVVLTRRTIQPYAGHWTLPAGYEEYDESPVDTAVRETREETGLEVRAFGLYDVRYTTDDPRKRGILSVYLCEVIGGSLCAGDDAADARFFPIEALPPLDEIGFANNRAILNRLRDEHRAGALRYLPIESPGPEGR